MQNKFNVPNYNLRNFTNYHLEVNIEKTKYMLLSRHQNAGQNHDIKTGNRCFGNVEHFRYFYSILIYLHANLIASYKVSMNKDTETNAHRQSHNVAAKNNSSFK
jgi:hypothetical protein